MKTYKYSEARQHFSAILNMALNDDVLITRRDGNKFKIVSLLKPQKRKSPLDIAGVNTGATTAEIIRAVRQSRSRPDTFLRGNKRPSLRE
ncbi:MAG: type II toxin-antitoxin system Phd/YefM family antitoxin [Candidatus Margulisbacteria bacterium]|jgi:hypothetical protein|nr:type II toxin-antitoxin system Phd/YefM family antitoxin [Candidatus Margulisiibacteriota bacterium]